jgi:microcystin-dependent protein
MNRIEYAQGGFPLSIERMEDMQECWALIAQLAKLIGDAVVVSGCEVSGTQVSSGYVVMNGELLPFEGGTAQTYVKVQETVDTLEYKDGNTHNYLTRRKAVFSASAAVGAVRWADFMKSADSIQALQTRVTPAQLGAEVSALNTAIGVLRDAIEALGGDVSGQITQTNNNIVPKYGIIPYGKSIALSQTSLQGVLSVIPYGYVPCGDVLVPLTSSWASIVSAWNAYLQKIGLNPSLTTADTSNAYGVLKFATRLSLPNLTGRFLTGAGNAYAVGDTGGENSHKLTTDEMPTHSHPVNTSRTAMGALSIGISYDTTGDPDGATDTYTGTAENRRYLRNARMGTLYAVQAGGDGTHENRPPYYALYYLIKMI